jgi:hypothetical protein
VRAFSAGISGGGFIARNGFALARSDTVKVDYEEHLTPIRVLRLRTILKVNTAFTAFKVFRPSACRLGGIRFVLGLGSWNGH